MASVSINCRTSKSRLTCTMVEAGRRSGQYRCQTGSICDQPSMSVTYVRICMMSLRLPPALASSLPSDFSICSAWPPTSPGARISPSALRDVMPDTNTSLPAPSAIVKLVNPDIGTR